MDKEMINNFFNLDNALNISDNRINSIKNSKEI